MKRLVFALVPIGALAACSLPENSKLAQTSCEKIAISETRNMFVCDEYTATLDALDVAAAEATHPLLRKPASALDAKDVARKFDIPPSEISGIVTATTRNQKPATLISFVELNGTKFAVYQRGDTKIYVERKR